MRSRSFLLRWPTAAALTVLISGLAAFALLARPGNGPEEDALLSQARAQFRALPQVFETADNPLSPEKVALGKLLFYDTRISADGTVSCFKCHWLNLYGTDGLKTSVGHNCAANSRNSPTVLNAAGEISEHWVGNRRSVEDQAAQALLGPGSYGLPSYAEAERRLRAIPGYEALFKAAFPGDSDPVSAANFGRAVGAFERTLTTPSRFDMFLAGGQGSLEPAEKNGLAVFLRTGCAACHNGPLVGGALYRKFGLTGDYWKFTSSAAIDKGRFTVTGKDADLYVFKVPPLRNVRMTAPYFHDGSVGRLEDAVRIMGKLQLGRTLSDADVEGIVKFLGLLTGTVPEGALLVPLTPRER
jgi:cytochrome c peroxidase